MIKILPSGIQRVRKVYVEDFKRNLRTYNDYVKIRNQYVDNALDTLESILEMKASEKLQNKLKLLRNAGIKNPPFTGRMMLRLFSRSEPLSYQRKNANLENHSRNSVVESRSAQIVDVIWVKAVTLTDFYNSSWKSFTIISTALIEPLSVNPTIMI